MRFLIHGTITPEIAAALTRHEHKAHTMDELGEISPPPSTETSGSVAGSPAQSPDPAELFQSLARRQWFLLTDNAALVHQMFEEKIPYPGIIILLVNAPDAPAQSAALDRLFERYKRLTPKRLYTITPNRVKIRQLPGAVD